MRLTQVLLAFAASVGLSAEKAAMHYSYTGDDPSQWTSSVIHQGTSGSASAYTTFIGADYAPARIVTDAAGNTYVAGRRLFQVFLPTFSAPVGLSDAFVTKLDPSGAVLFTATIGGKVNDEVRGLALDPAGNIYLAGSTTSPNFPLRNPLQSEPGGGFLVKLGPDGSRLIYSTYFGGTRATSAVNAITADASGNAYVTGTTFARDFPQTEGLRYALIGLGEGPGAVSGAFVTKISAAGDRILYSGLIASSGMICGGSTCFLSTKFNVGVGIGLDSAGNTYIAGNTNTISLPTTPGAFAPQGIGAFAAKVNAAGSALVYLTYLGTTSYMNQPFPPSAANTVNALAVDSAGNAYLAGRTTDARFPATRGVYQPAFSGPGAPSLISPQPPSDAFVAKLNPDGSSLVWATYLGGPAAESATAVAVDLTGNVWMVGTTASPDFPNSNGWSSGSDFVVGLNPEGAALLYSARFPADTASGAMTVDSTGAVHVTGLSGLVSALEPRQPPAMFIGYIVNAAGSLPSGRIAPGEILSIFGPGIGPATPATAALDSSGRVTRSLAGAQVFFDDLPAPLLYVSSNQINVVAPFGLASKTSARVRVAFGGARSPDFPAVVFPTEPQVFRNAMGYAAALNEDGSLNSPDRPARAGSVVTIWATGTGWVPAADGAVADSAQDFHCCQVRVGSLDAAVLYAGASPGFVAGLTQINFRLPVQPYAGSAGLSLTAGTRSAAATIHVGN